MLVSDGRCPCSATDPKIDVSETEDENRHMARKEWEKKYRFFSRPFEVTAHPCGAFESIRMRNLFEVAYSERYIRDDPWSSQAPPSVPRSRGREAYRLTIDSWWEFRVALQMREAS